MYKQLTYEINASRMANSNNRQPAKSPRVTRRKKSLLSWNLKRAVESVALCVSLCDTANRRNFLFIFLSCTYSRKRQFSSPFAGRFCARSYCVVFRVVDVICQVSFLRLLQAIFIYFTLAWRSFLLFSSMPQALSSLLRSFCAVSGRMQELLRLCCARSAFPLDCNCDSTCTQGVQQPRVKWEIDGKSVARELEQFGARRRKWTRHQSWTPFSRVSPRPVEVRTTPSRTVQFGSTAWIGSTGVLLDANCTMWRLRIYIFFFQVLHTARARAHVRRNWFEIGQ